MKRHVLLVLALLAGCFDSLVDNPCAAGYEYSDGACIAFEAPDGGVDPTGDGGVDPTGDGSVDPTGDGGAPPVCEAPEVVCDGACVDLQTDPDHCGACGRVCASGLCEAGHCVGELSGHIVIIGHDYREHHAAMARMIGNAVALGPKHRVLVGRLRGSADEIAIAGTTRAITAAMNQMNRPWQNVALPATPSVTALDGVHVLVVDAQIGEASGALALGTAWAQAIDTLLQRGGIVVVLEGAGGVGHQFSRGANLIALDPPIDSTNLPAVVVDASDAVAQAVISPYLAEPTSVAFPGQTGPITTMQGTVVVHRTRY